jgi:hypothetical protein
MSHLRRAFIGLTFRLIIATGISLIVWWLFTTPFDRLPLPRLAVSFLVRILDFPVALAGELLYPIRGMEVVFEHHDTWCDFCPIGEMFRQQMRIAIPVYLLLLYIPTLLRSVARRDARLFKRIVIGLLIYTVFTGAFFLTVDGDHRGDDQIAAMWFVILASAAAFAWSDIGPRWRIGSVAAVLLLGAWAFRFMMTFGPPKMNQIQLNYVSLLLLLILGVGGTLWLIWAVERGIELGQHRHLRGDGHNVEKRQDQDNREVPPLEATDCVFHSHIHFVHKHLRSRRPTDMLGSHQTLRDRRFGNRAEPTSDDNLHAYLNLPRRARVGWLPVRSLAGIAFRSGRCPDVSRSRSGRADKEGGGERQFCPSNGQQSTARLSFR